MDSGAAGHVMPGTMFPRVKLERKMLLKKLVAANGEQIQDFGEKNIPFKTNEGIQRCITFRSANVVKPLISMRKVVRSGNIVVLDEKNPHMRKHARRNGDQGGCEQWCVHNGHGLDEISMKQVQFSGGRDSEWSSRFRQGCKAGSIVQR